MGCVLVRDCQADRGSFSRRNGRRVHALNHPLVLCSSPYAYASNRASISLPVCLPIRLSPTGMGAQKITKKMDDDIQEATRQLSDLKVGSR